MIPIVLRKSILNIFHTPNLCKKIDIIKYPWGWKSNDQIKEIINFPIKKLNQKNEITDKKITYIHEYKIKEYAEEIFQKTYYAFISNYDFLNTPLISPKLAIGLNYLRSQNKNDLCSNLKINNVNLLDSWVKYGSVKNITKFMGFYNDKEIIHEITAGIIGPEIQSIWDQRSLKQKVRLMIESSTDQTEKRNDVIDFERDLMTINGEWQLSNINRIII